MVNGRYIKDPGMSKKFQDQREALNALREEEGIIGYLFRPAVLEFQGQPLERQVFKMQIPLFASDGVDNIMIYNQDRSVDFIIPANEDFLNLIFKGRPKVYVEATISPIMFKVYKIVGDHLNPLPW